jgi:hypothetical protein
MSDKSKQNPKKPMTNFAGASVAKNAGGMKAPVKMEKARADKTLPKGKK